MSSKTSRAQTPAVVDTTTEKAAPTSTLPPVVGINFGNSYASIAVFTKVRNDYWWMRGRY